MTTTGQTASIYQGTDQTLTLTIPIGSSGLDHTDVSAVTLTLSRGGVAAITRTLAAAQITVATVGTNIVYTCALVPADTPSFSGVYDVEWLDTIDGATDQRATGTITIRAAVSS